LWVALRSLSVATSQPFPEDVDRAHDIQVGRASPVRVRVVHPPKELRGPSLDFDAVKMRAWYEDGLRTARAAEPDEVAVARAP
jgi:hypothetical protein